LPKTNQVLPHMRNQRRVGDLFKRNFVIYVVYTLIKGQQSLKVNHIIFKNLMDLKEVKELNWCEFTLDSLITCIDKWNRQPKGSYRGLILFLMVMVLLYIF